MAGQAELLFLAHRLPYPPNKGDKIRSYHLLKHLSSRYRVALGTFVDEPADWRYVPRVEAMCHASCFRPLAPRRARLRSLRGLLGSVPLTLPYYADRKLRSWVRLQLCNPNLRTVVIFSSSMAQYVDTDQLQGRRSLLDLVDVDSEKWRQYADQHRSLMSWLYRREGRTLLRFERQAIKRFDLGTFVSYREAELFRRLAPEQADRVEWFGNGVDTAWFSPQQAGDDPYSGLGPVLVFTGALDYWANVEAVRWFAREVFPRVLARVPTARLAVVGARPAAEVIALDGLPGVVVIGQVKDVRPYIAHATLSIAPLRIARGIQNKVLEAMSMGKPVVATAEAAEGIEARAGEELLVASGEEAMSGACLRLLNDGALRAVMGAQARQRAEVSFSWSGRLHRLDTWLDGVRMVDDDALVAT